MNEWEDGWMNKWVSISTYALLQKKYYVCTTCIAVIYINVNSAIH